MSPKGGTLLLGKFVFEILVLLLLPWLPVVMTEATWKRPIRHRRL
jgi:hypothetical protein